MMEDSGSCPSVYWNPIYFIVRLPEYLQGHGEIELAALEGKLRRRSELCLSYNCVAEREYTSARSGLGAQKIRPNCRKLQNLSWTICPYYVTAQRKTLLGRRIKRWKIHFFL